MKEELLKKEAAEQGSGAEAAALPAKPKKKFRIRRRDVFIYGGLAWAVIHFLVFWVYVNVGTVVNSFFGERLDGSTFWQGLYNYGEVFSYVFGGKVNGIISLRSCLNTLSMIALALVINLPLTLLFSYAIYKKIRFHSILRVGMYLPCVVSLVILSLFYATFVSGAASNGPLFSMLEAAGADSYIVQNGLLTRSDTAWWGVIIFSVWTGVNGNIIYFSSAMARLPDSVLESAELDGATQMRQFRSIVIPMIWPTITTMSITLIGGTVAWFQPVQLMVGISSAADTQTGTMAWIIVSQVTGGHAVGFPAAFGVVISIVFSALVLLFKWGMEKVFTEVEY